MERRTLLRAAALGTAGLAAPRIGRAQGAGVLRFVPYVDLAILDPMVNTASQTRTYGYMVFDTLYAQDGSYRHGITRARNAQGRLAAVLGYRWRRRYLGRFGPPASAHQGGRLIQHGQFRLGGSRGSLDGRAGFGLRAMSDPIHSRNVQYATFAMMKTTGVQHIHTGWLPKLRSLIL